MTSTIKSSSRKSREHQTNQEMDLLQRLVQRASESGVFMPPADVVNFYVAFKSKTLILLKGPAESGKLDFVRFFAHTLIGKANHQCQLMVGHPYWASGSENVALFTEAQARYNTEKVLTLIEEAWQPENRWKVFIACLARVSSAEIDSFFSATAFQLGRGQIMSLPYAHFLKPIPFPPNLSIVGTVDSPCVHIMDEDLLSKTAILNWPDEPDRRIVNGSNASASQSYERPFLRSRIRSEYSARSRLRKILGWGMKELEPLRRIEDLLDKHGVHLSSRTRGQAQIFLANAWTKDHAGLFHSSQSENLLTALDWAISHTLLPNLTGVVKSDKQLRQRLSTELGDQFPRTLAYLNERFFDHQESRRQIQDGLRDLVCGMQVDSQRAARKSEYQGCHYYFCSNGCKKAFDKDPQKYIKPDLER